MEKKISEQKLGEFSAAVGQAIDQFLVTPEAHRIASACGYVTSTSLLNDKQSWDNDALWKEAEKIKHIGYITPFRDLLIVFSLVKCENEFGNVTSDVDRIFIDPKFLLLTTSKIKSLFAVVPEDFETAVLSVDKFREALDKIDELTVDMLVDIL